MGFNWPWYGRESMLDHRTLRFTLFFPVDPLSQGPHPARTKTASQRVPFLIMIR